MTIFTWNIPNAALSQLKSKGYTIIDNVLGSKTAEYLRNEMLNAVQSSPNLLTQNNTILLNKNEKVLVPKPNIGEFDFTSSLVKQSLKSMDQLGNDQDFMRILNNGLHLDIDKLQIKAQVNFGQGACFPIHLDTDYTQDKRKITAIIYLNETDGGELVLYPFPYEKVTVEPKMDRMVLFSSAFCLHRVLPARTPRLCFTVWCAGKEFIKVDPLTELNDIIPLSALYHPWYRSLLAKSLYVDEWLKSIKESHQDTPSRQILIDNLLSDVEIIDKKISPFYKRHQSAPISDIQLQWF
ncbi:hypothetical protein HDV06_003011 [Boothiomyces sp. JEL0866]|nr:hypothetical protein HDV06_003006 [Boothiomyces sp. JEL0866]KAJ3322467.1 hypothetical protein HDV06_003011 [Boothiomyces sp. JEL0866]